MLQDGGALRVSDAVKVILCGLDVFDFRGDRVRGRELILLVCPLLAARCESGPLIAKFGGFNQAERALIISEGFLQPQVIPPLWGDQVAKPHVAHFVEDHVCAGLACCASGLVSRDHFLVESNAPGVFHCAEVVFRHEDLVVLAPRICEPVVAVIEVQASARHAENVVRVQVGLQSAATVDSKWNINGLAVGGSPAPNSTIDVRVGAGHHCGDEG